MTRSLRITMLLVFALAASVTVNAASAQMMHFTLNVVIETEDGSDIPDGEVCVSGEVDPICQDTGGNPSGREFSFSGLADGDHEVTVNAGDYLEIVDTVTLTENTTTITLTLEMEQTPPPPDTLPDTGSGPMASSSPVTSLMLLLFGGLALALTSLGFTQRREGR